MHDFKPLVEFLARSLTGSPAEVAEHGSRGGTVVLTVKVDQPDRGKLIGRQGRTARALRSVLAAAGQKHNQRCVLEIQD